MKLRLIAFATVLFGIFDSASQVFAYTPCTVTGTVLTPGSAPATSRNQPCDMMIVSVMDCGVISDTELGNNRCDQAGAFSITVDLDSGDDLYLVAEYYTWLTALHDVVVVPEGTTSGSRCDALKQTYLWSPSLASSYWPDYSGGTLACGTMNLNRSGSNLGTEPLILRRVRQTYGAFTSVVIHTDVLL